VRHDGAEPRSVQVGGRCAVAVLSPNVAPREGMTKLCKSYVQILYVIRDQCRIRSPFQVAPLQHDTTDGLRLAGTSRPARCVLVAQDCVECWKG
jgi:hypothetical protein